MRAVSTFSGVGGFDLGLARAGIDTALQAESDEWCRAVLAHRFPGVPCLADVRDVGTGGGGEPAGRVAPDGLRARADVGRGQAGAGLSGGVDLLHGGFPCQDVSVSGKRAGLAGVRSGLFYEFARIADAVRPRWLLLENVPGLLSSNDGRDFGAVLGTLAEIGYGCAWRVLDSRHFGVPQRRRRVFVVGHLGGDSGRALHALCEGCGGHPAASRCSWEEAAGGARGGAEGDGGYLDVNTAPTLKSSPGGGGNYGAEMPMVLAGCASELDVAAPLLTNAQGGLRTTDIDGGTWAFSVTPDVASGLGALNGQGHDRGIRIAFNLRGRDEGVRPEVDDLASIRAASGGSSRSYIAGSRVRRLTPRECERLQGFPDDWTLIPGVACPDSRRYAAMGNAVTVNVAEWIGRRIIATEENK